MLRQTNLPKFTDHSPEDAVRRGGASAITRTDFDALLLDLDGVVTRTAAVHATAWKRLFDDYLRAHAARGRKPFEPFDRDRDYREYVDGKPRDEGVRSFLASRGISLPEGRRDDDPAAETVCGLGKRKNEYFRAQLVEKGVEVYDSTIAFITQAKSAGFRIAVVSSSKNCADVLAAAGLAGVFDARVDGVEMERVPLRGKPAPDTFLEAARRLDADPRRAIVVEDAIAGVQAGRSGGFGLVIGIDRAGHAAGLWAAGADLVVSDLREVALDARWGPRQRRSRKTASVTPAPDRRF